MFAWRRTALRRRVVLNMTTGQAFRGVLWAKRGPLVVLRAVTLLEHGNEIVFDGELVVERDKVAFLQVFEGAAS